MIIEDGHGNSFKLKVDSNGRASVVALNRSAEHEANHVHGISYSLLFSATPTGPGDCFFYMKNTDDRDMIVEGIGMYLPAAEYFDIFIRDDGVPVSGSNITPGNLNGGSGKEAQGIFQNGNDITGLSGGVNIYRYKHDTTSTETIYHNLDQDVILPKNSTLSLYVQTGTTALFGFLDFYYIDSE